jgi:SAM-dependent methyltransferase
MKGEVEQIRDRYLRRDHSSRDIMYSALRSDRFMAEQEKERIFLSMLSRFDLAAIKTIKVLEIGCGGGANILQFLRWGFPPENIKGSELMPDRCAQARHLLPVAVEIIEGDALGLRLPEDSFDIVLVSTVFTSILDESFRAQLAAKIWSLVKPGGAILWYDFIYNNPSNADVTAVTRRRLLELFPEANVRIRKITLAPPIARLVCSVHPVLYSLFNLLPFLRTHLAAWLEKATGDVAFQGGRQRGCASGFRT